MSRRRRRPLSLLSTPGNRRQTLQCCPNPPLPALTPHLQFSHLPSPPPHSPSKATLQRLRPQHHHVLSFWRTGTQSCGRRRVPCSQASTSLLLLPIRHMHQGTRPPSSALTTTNHLLNSHSLSLGRPLQIFARPRHAVQEDSLQVLCVRRVHQGRSLHLHPPSLPSAASAVQQQARACMLPPAHAAAERRHEQRRGRRQAAAASP